MGRGVSCGGGQSSLGYLFGGGEAPKPSKDNGVESTSKPANDNVGATQNVGGQIGSNEMTPPAQKSADTAAPSADITKKIPAGVPRSTTNNYFRAEGQNCGNFLTDRPTTKVHAAPGGGSSLGYLFGSGGGGSSSN